MEVDLVPATYRAEAWPLLVKHDGQIAVCVLDGIGSWGFGVAAAAWVRAQLSGTWATNPPESALRVVQLLEAAVFELPPSLRDPEYGHSFSVASLLSNAAGIWVVAAGSFGIVQGTLAGVAPLFAPQTWVGQQVSAGILTNDEAFAHPLNNVCVGPYVSPEERGSLFVSGPHPRDATYVIAHLGLFRRLSRSPVSSWLHLSAASLKRLASEINEPPSGVVIVRPTAAA